jgi:fructose-bisphosphate aldolase class I
MVEKVDYRKELMETANRIARPGFGILAADESTGTLGKRFESIGLENNAENARRYRELLFTTPDIEKYISGVILFDETTKQGTKDGKNFVKLLQEKGIVPGVKVDKGVAQIPGALEGETATLGLDDLAKRAKAYYDHGIRFAKWRAVLKIGDGAPTELAIQENAWGLARYASICQENGLVPIVEPEILADGDHNIDTALKVFQRVNAAVVKALHDNNIFFEGILLKPNMVTPGTSSTAKVSALEIAQRTVVGLSRTLPAAVPGVVFLSGGQSEEEASVNLNEMNRLEIKRPWVLSFSYGRALQHSTIRAWAGKDENLAKAQEVFITRAKANSEATLGKYQGSKDASASESLYVPNYKY